MRQEQFSKPENDTRLKQGLSAVAQRGLRIEPGIGHSWIVLVPSGCVCGLISEQAEAQMVGVRQMALLSAEATLGRKP